MAPLFQWLTNLQTFRDTVLVPCSQDYVQEKFSDISVPPGVIHRGFIVASYCVRI
jgi:hypothetical protein